jgi:hypothetical protein
MTNSPFSAFDHVHDLTSGLVVKVLAIPFC